MSRFKKVIITIYSLYIVLVLAISFFLVKPNESTYKYLDSLNRDTVLILIGIAIFLIFIRWLVSMFQKSDEDYLVLGDNDGNIMLSTRAIEKTVLKCLDKFENVVEKSVKVKIKSKQGQEPCVDIVAKCGVKDEISDDVCKVAQEEAHKSLEDLLGFRINKLDMKFYQLKEKKSKDDTNTKNDNNKKTFNKKVSRVK